MSGICDKCRREPCRMKWDGLYFCDFYERGETRYERLFGTPEKTAQTLVDNCEKSHFCEGCIADTGDHDCTYDALLEWLRGDAE